MFIIRMLLREIRHRKLNFISALIAVITAVGLFVGVFTACEASRRETIRLMRNMGFNLIIVPEGTDMVDFWSQDYARKEMPEEYVHRLANSKDLSIQHLVARLQKRIEWRGRKILLTGILPEVQMKYLPAKSAMIEAPEPGTVYVGYELWRGTDIQVGQEIELSDKSFRVAMRLEEQGTKDDIRIYGHLHDVQEVLGKPGRINEVEALGCLCLGDALADIRQQLARELPGTHVTEFRSIAIMRAETRKMIENYAALIIPAILIVAAVWVGLLALGNVRERRAEIGVLRAMGVSSWPIAVLFLGKAVLIGLVGAALGFVLGTWLASHFGPQVFPLTARKIAPMYSLLSWSLIGAALMCVVASYLPIVQGVMQDPAQVLREE